MIEKLAKRKQIELGLKIKTLEKELEAWFNRSAESGVLEKHHTQIRALQAHLNGWHVAIDDKLNSYKKQEADQYLRSCANAEILILSEQRIWDYFRSKLIQRHEDLFSSYLQAADEFAWACYRPIQELIYPDVEDAKRKEPPLVFLNGGASPFSVSRDRSFQAESVPGAVLNLTSQDQITKLPIPVVGVPWNQLSHLPEVLVIGHEVGHIVEDDFGLTVELKQILNAALTQARANKRKKAWHSWLGEIFADLYGCLAAGPAFAGTLIDFLAKSKDSISSEEKVAAQLGEYPTDYLRVRIILKALELMKFKKEIKDYQSLWANYSSMMAKGFTEDIDYIVPALLDGKLKGLRNKSIKQVFCFSDKQQENVERTLAELKKLKPDTAVEIPTTDIRVLFAALRLAYELDSEQYVANEYAKAALDHIKAKVIKKGVRSGEKRLDDKQLEKKLSAYESAGADFIKNIMSSLNIN
ncbi:MAG: hypothetical protein ACRD8U_10095 [Pyrinomonadaceae bacterium]